MGIANFLLIITAVLLNALAQLFLRKGMLDFGHSLGSFFDFFVLLPKLLSNQYNLAGFLCYGLSIGLWMVVLSKVQVSVAYPMQSLGYVFVAITAYFIFGEIFTTEKGIGVGFIILGVFFLSRA